MVESTQQSNKFEDEVKTFKETVWSSFGRLKSNLPEEQMKRAGERIPKMLALKGKLQELME